MCPPGNERLAIEHHQLSCVLNVLQGKAYAAAYVLLTRAQVLLTHVIVPYADLTLTNFSTSPQFRLTRGNFLYTYKNQSSDWQNQAVDDEDVEEEEEDDEVPPAEARRARS